LSVKVIAVGNTLMGDDCIGIRVLERIQVSLNSYGIETFIGETDTQYCISIIEDKDFIFIIDAAVLGKKTGDLTIISLERYRYCEICCTQHANSLLDMLHIYYKDINGYVIGIEAENIAYSLEISRSLELLLEKISLRVLNKILELAPKNISK
jgi:hydrogenase maturation protease